MTDVSGIPNMGFGGGGYFGGIPNQQPAMSADQINASMWGRYSPQQAQHTLDNIYGPGGFGAQPAYYAGLGAAYGRSTGGFGTPGSNPGWQDPTPPENVGNVDAGKWGTMTPQEQLAHNQAVGRDEISFNLGNVDATKWSTMTPQEKFDHNNAVKRDRGITPSQFGWDAYSGGGIGSDAARVPAASPNRPRFPVQSQDWDTTFTNMTAGNSYQPYSMGLPSWYPSQRYGDYNAALDRMRAGRGWTIAQQPTAASQGTLTSRINQSIYDLGNAGNAYSNSIGGGFGMNLPNSTQTLTPQDLAIPHAYPPEVRNPYINPNPGG